MSSIEYNTVLLLVC